MNIVNYATGMLSIFNYLVDAYLLYAVLVLVANSVLRSLFGVG
jgi:hypothetical protein